MIHKIMNECVPISSTSNVARYLENRGLRAILDDLPTALYEHPALEYWEDGKMSVFPAMVAPVVDLNREIVALHRTYLFDGSKATVKNPKKFTQVAWPGATTGAAIPLYEDYALESEDDDRQSVFVAEGIESALAVRLWTGGIATWACGSAHGMRSLALPPTVQIVTVCPDNDEAGLAAASTLAKRLASEGRSVMVQPPRMGRDPLEYWLELELLRGAGHG
jgi:putative DNA primase/helicase